MGLRRSGLQFCITANPISLELGGGLAAGTAQGRCTPNNQLHKSLSHAHERFKRLCDMSNSRSLQQSLVIDCNREGTRGKRSHFTHGNCSWALTLSWNGCMSESHDICQDEPRLVDQGSTNHFASIASQFPT